MSKMPMLFVGHGSPMNAIEDNVFTQTWTRLGCELPRPEAILSISAHWYTEGTRINDDPQPQTIYDMYGFPKELYEIVYGAPGAPQLAHRTSDLISCEVQVDNTWGLDHSTWSVLHRMYPEADIPVYQLSVDRYAPPAVHLRIGRELRPLRNRGVLILGSGNIVHNLSKVRWDMAGGYPWADAFDSYIKESILDGRYEDVVQYERAGSSAELAFYMPDHFYPLLYVLGAAWEDDHVSVFNEACVMGSVSMTGYLFE